MRLATWTGGPAERNGDRATAASEKVRAEQRGGETSIDSSVERDMAEGGETKNVSSSVASRSVRLCVNQQGSVERRMRVRAREKIFEAAAKTSDQSSLVLRTLARKRKR